MIDFVASFRPFENNFWTIQHNAVASWKAIAPKSHLFVSSSTYPADTSTKAFISVLSGKFIGEVTDLGENGIHDENGVLLVNRLWNEAWNNKRSDVLWMANSDNIYFPHSVKAVELCKREFPEFVMIGRKTDLLVEHLISFYRPDMFDDLYQRAKALGQIKNPGIDYFAVYTTDNIWEDMPDFRIGRLRYDNWMVWKALELGIPVIDSTAFNLIVHQSHGDREGKIKEETTFNRNALTKAQMKNVGDATYVMEENGTIHPRN